MEKIYPEVFGILKDETIFNGCTAILDRCGNIDKVWHNGREVIVEFIGEQDDKMVTFCFVVGDDVQCVHTHIINQCKSLGVKDISDFADEISDISENVLRARVLISVKDNQCSPMNLSQGRGCEWEWMKDCPNLVKILGLNEKQDKEYWKNYWMSQDNYRYESGIGQLRQEAIEELVHVMAKATRLDNGIYKNECRYTNVEKCDEGARIDNC